VERIHTDKTGENKCELNVREQLWGNEEWTIQRNWQHWVLKTQEEDKQTKNTAKYV